MKEERFNRVTAATQNICEGRKSGDPCVFPGIGPIRDGWVATG